MSLAARYLRAKFVSEPPSTRPFEHRSCQRFLTSAEFDEPFQSTVTIAIQIQSRSIDAGDNQLDSLTPFRNFFKRSLCKVKDQTQDQTPFSAGTLAALAPANPRLLDRCNQNVRILLATTIPSPAPQRRYSRCKYLKKLTQPTASSEALR